ncbi:3709_t:CDS:1, partial [Gigaspora rosea]
IQGYTFIKNIFHEMWEVRPKVPNKSYPIRKLLSNMQSKFDLLKQHVAELLVENTTFMYSRIAKDIL